MNIRFTKMSGAGNDFVVIDNRRGAVRNPAGSARLLCDRRLGIGADGLLLLEKSRRASYRMMYYNADGSFGGMCGNGGRCIARFAVIHRIAARKHDFEALGHVYSAVVRQESVMLRMKDPWDLRHRVKVKLKAGWLEVEFVNTGSPHVVIPIGGSRFSGFSLEKVPVVEMGREIRGHRLFAPEGTNVNFIQKAGTKSIRIRTYERGVEDETLACGTGSIASAIIASIKWGLEPPILVEPRSGSILKVTFERDGDFISNVHLSGPAESTFEGTISLKL